MVITFPTAGIAIDDTNQNNLYDPATDPVTDLNGQPISASAKATGLNQVLKQLHTPHWKGILLGESSFYLDMLIQAEAHAGQGEVEETQIALNNAHSVAKHLPFSFDQKRANQAYEKSLTLGIPARLQLADAVAKVGGNIQEVKSFLDQAKYYDSELTGTLGAKPIFNPARADRILEEAYRKGIPNLYPEAFAEAQKGDLDSVKASLKEIQNYVTEANRNFQIGLSYDQQRADLILEEAYRKAIPRYYQEAERQALKGLTRSARALLNRVQTTINEANQTFSLQLQFDTARADKILEIGLMNGIEDNFRLAVNRAKAGDASGAHDWLNLARDYVNEYNQKFSSLPGRQRLSFDQTRADAILGCAQGMNACP